MRLSDLLAPQISNRSRARGTEYFASGAVTHIERRDGIVHATVRGERNYDVWIEPVGSQLRTSCTCPHFIDHFQICKHIWAVVLLAEKRGIPLIEPGPAPSNLTLEAVDVDTPYGDEDDGDELDDLDESEELDDDVPWSPPVSGWMRGQQAPASPLWQQQLEKIVTRSTISPAPASGRLPEGQVLYVVDIDGSLAAGALVIELMTRDRKANGEWGKPRAARVLAGDLRALPPGPDRAMFERLLGARPHYDGNGAYVEYGELGRFRLQGVLAQEVLPLLCAGDRCWARVRPPAAAAPPPATAQRLTQWHRGGQQWLRRAKPDPPTYQPLHLDEGDAWHFTLSVSRDEGSRVYRIDGDLTRGDQRMAVSDPLLVLHDGLLVTNSHIARLDHHRAFGWLAVLRHGSMAVPFDARPSLIDALLAEPPRLAGLPDDLRIDVEDGEAKPRLRLTPVRHRPDRLLAHLSFDYGGVGVSSTMTTPIVRTADASRAIRRDLNAERAFADRLHGAGFRQEWTSEVGGKASQVSTQMLPRVVRALVAEGWQVEARGVRYRQPTGVAIGVRSGVDWFDLEGHADYDGELVALPTLLAALQRGEAFVTLGDGSVGLLPEDWLRQHAPLAALGKADGDRLRFKPSQVALLDALLAALPQALCDETFARARRELAAFDGVTPADPPATFVGSLRSYQRDGLGWLRFLRQFGFGGCLADDMGLGKTVMVLALLAHCRSECDVVGPSLVVAPRSLVFNWREEAARFTPHLRVLEYTGGRRAAERERFSDHDIVLTTYGTLRRDAAHLASIAFEYVILDESQAIKNAASASAKATRLLTASHRLALSGTPIENHLGELWSLFEFLNPGVLGSSPVFDRTAGRNLDEAGLALLSRGLRPFILRRTKEQVAPELPPKTEQTLYCELERPQRALYDELRDHYRRTLLARVNGDGFRRAKLQVLEALLRLRQAACHPGLIDAKRRSGPSAKLEVLVPHIAQAVEEHHKTLVFSQFTSLLSILRERLDADGLTYEYLDGQTRDRESRVERFQTDPECRLFLISLKAGGVGLNLTAAEYVFLLDPWWNPAVEAQAIDRAHRIGQNRHVFAYRLIAKDTVEERVLELQRNKQTLANAILTADEGLMRMLKREDLELLLS